MSKRNVISSMIGGTTTTIIGGGCGWIFYDYKTCHPMRQMQGYDIHGAWIRFHNTFRPKFTLPIMTLEDLAKFDGTSSPSSSSSNNNNNKKNTNTNSIVYFASDGWVWDVSQSRTFQQTYGLWKGKDASIALGKMSLDSKDVNRTDWEHLSPQEWKSLQSWTDYFYQKYIITGQIKDFPRKK